MTKTQKRPPKSSENEMLIFGLRSNSYDRPSNESQPKCDKRPLSHREMKNSFLYYIQLLMTGQAIRCPPPPQQKKIDFFKSTFLT